MMLALCLSCAVLLVAQDPAPPPIPPTTADLPLTARPAPTAAEIAALDKYEELRGKVPNTAAAHWKMAQWCEQNGLRAESFFHYGRVVELDPKRDLAWQKLGFKRHDGRWMTAEQIADDEAQARLDREWTVRLKKWHTTLHGKKKQGDPAEAQAELDKIEDPAAVPAVYREFCGGAPPDQAIGVQILSQIPGPIASKAIAALAVYGKTPEIRRQATETLRGRPAEEFLDMLVSLMKDLIRYETRPVGGPGSPGVLFVEGERFNSRRFYAPPPPPSYTPRPGDMITYDSNGLPVVSRSQVLASVESKVGVAGSKTLVNDNTLQFTDTQTYAIGSAYVQAQQAAKNAQAQLANDIAQLESINSTRRSFNDLVMTAAQAATGKTPGWTAQDWRNLLATNQPQSPKPAPYRPKATIDEMVPLNYAPNLAATMRRGVETRFITQIIVDS